MNEIQTINKSIARDDFSNPVIVFYFLALGILAAFIAYNYKAYLKQVLIANISNRINSDKKREESNQVRKAGNWLHLFFLLTSSILTFIGLSMLNESGKTFTDAQLLLISLGIVFIGYITKYALKFFLGFVFQKKELTTYYFNNVGIRDKAFSIVILPLLILQYFALPLKEITFWAIVLISSIYLALRWVSGVITGIKHGNLPFFYSILYICTLEIAPLAICVKAFSMPILNA